MPNRCGSLEPLWRKAFGLADRRNRCKMARPRVMFEKVPYVAEEYPYDAKNNIVGLVQTLETLIKRDPEQEVQGIALPVLDAVIESVRAARRDDPVVEAVRSIISAEHMTSGDPVRAAHALLVAKQLDTAIGAYSLVVA